MQASRAFARDLSLRRLSFLPATLCRLSLCRQKQSSLNLGTPTLERCRANVASVSWYEPLPGYVRRNCALARVRAR